VPLVLDLRIAHDRFGSSSDPCLNGLLHYPNDIDKSLNESGADKIRKYRPDYNNTPPTSISLMPAVASTSGRLIVSSCDFYSYRFIGKLTNFLPLIINNLIFYIKKINKQKLFSLKKNNKQKGLWKNMYGERE
jgi:hypothetical protein